MHRGSFRVAVRSSLFSGPRNPRNETPFLRQFGRAPTGAHRMRGAGWRSGRCISTALLVLFATCVLCHVANATTVVGAGMIRTVANPGIALHIPADGRLDGNGFAIDITGYRFAYQVGYGSSTKDAGAGQALLVFGLSGSGSDLTANLEVDGQGAPLPHATTPNASTPAYYLASVPQGAQDVALQVSANGFSQTFSFTKGRREGSQPAVLYRGQGQWEQVDNIGQVSYVNTPDKVDGQMYSRVEFTLTSATLTYFLPSTGATPASSSKAWVVLAGSAVPDLAPDDPGGESEMGIDYLKTLPGSDLTLSLPGQAPIPAMLTGQGGADDESGENGADGGWGLLGGDYYWQVPAGIVSATLRVDLPPQLLAVANNNGSPLEVPVEGEVPPVHIAFAPPVALSPITGANPPPWAPNPAITQPVTAGRVGSAKDGGHNTASAPVNPSGGGGSSNDLLARLVAVALVGMLCLALVSRRRLLVALSGLTASPAQKRAAAVRDFLPSPTSNAPGTPIASTAGPPGAPDATGTAGSHTRQPVSPPTVPEKTSTPVVPVLVPVPDGPAELDDDLLWALVLGPPMLSGERTGKDDLLRSELETACFLACNPGSTFSGEGLRAVIGASRDEDWSVRTIVTYVSGLRRKLGSQHVPDATGAGGYRLERVSTDAARFKELVAMAKAAQTSEQARHLAEALSLVRGAPFAGVPKGTYGWAFRTDSGPSLADDLGTVVVSAALVLARLAVDAGDQDLASWACAKGVLIWQTDLKLSMLQLDSASISPDATALGRRWSDITQRFAGNNEPVPDELVDYYRRLRNR